MMRANVSEFLRQLWRFSGVPGVAFVAWSIVTSAFYFRLLDVHSEQPALYKAPAKVAERKRAKGIINAGNIVLLTVFAFHLYGWKLENARREKETAGGSS